MWTSVPVLSITALSWLIVKTRTGHFCVTVTMVTPEMECCVMMSTSVKMPPSTVAMPTNSVTTPMEASTVPVRHGFSPDESSSSQLCIDDNECTLGSHNCHSQAICLNIDGGFECLCVDGYLGNGTACEGTHRHYCFVVVLEIAEQIQLSIERRKRHQSDDRLKAWITK